MNKENGKEGTPVQVYLTNDNNEVIERYKSAHRKLNPPPMITKPKIINEIFTELEPAIIALIEKMEKEALVEKSGKFL